MSNAATDDSVSFATHRRLIIADSIKNTLIYQNPNASTQILLANFNSTRNVSRQISIQNENTTGNKAYSLFTTSTDSSTMYIGSHGSSRTLTRLGLPVAKNNELVAIEGELHIGTREDKSIYFGTDDATRAIITETGDIGVGTNSPRAKVEIKGDLIEGRDRSDFGSTPTLGSCEVSHGAASFFTSSNNSTDYFHIKLPYKADVDAKMYRIHVSGYAYGSSNVIDLIYVGYVYYPSYPGAGALRNNQIINNGDPVITSTQYVGSDNHIYLRLKTPSVYYNSFRVDSMRVGNGRVIQSGEIEIFQTATVTL